MLFFKDFFLSKIIIILFISFELFFKIIRKVFCKLLYSSITGSNILTLLKLIFFIFSLIIHYI